VVPPWCSSVSFSPANLAPPITSYSQHLASHGAPPFFQWRTPLQPPPPVGPPILPLPILSKTSRRPCTGWSLPTSIHAHENLAAGATSHEMQALYPANIIHVTFRPQVLSNYAPNERLSARDWEAYLGRHGSLLALLEGPFRVKSSIEPSSSSPVLSLSLSTGIVFLDVFVTFLPRYLPTSSVSMAWGMPARRSAWALYRDSFAKLPSVRAALVKNEDCVPHQAMEGEEMEVEEKGGERKTRRRRRRKKRERTRARTREGSVPAFSDVETRTRTSSLFRPSLLRFLSLPTCYLLLLLLLLLLRVCEISTLFPTAAAATYKRQQSQAALEKPPSIPTALLLGFPWCLPRRMEGNVKSWNGRTKVWVRCRDWVSTGKKKSDRERAKAS